MKDKAKEKRIIRKAINAIPKSVLVDFLLVFYGDSPPKNIEGMLDWIKSFQVGMGTLVKKYVQIKYGDK